ncbi:MAG: GNAT family N-acetyltransferase [Aquabacterium sp.]
MTLPVIDLGGGACLRPWRADDAPVLSRLAGDVEVWRWMSDGFPHPYTLALAQHWVGPGHVDFGGDNWAIAQDDLAVGGCGVHQLDGPRRCNAEIGWWVGRDCWGRGLAPRAAMAMLAHAWHHWPEVTRIYAPIHAGNQRSMRVAQKCGLVLEGMQPRSTMKAGQVIDCAVYAGYRELA